MPSLSTYTNDIARRSTFGFSISTMTTLVLLLLLNSMMVHASPAMMFDGSVSQTIGAPGIFRRDSKCPSDWNTCPQSELSSFCCPSTADCLGTANNTSVACCPKGKDCRILKALGELPVDSPTIYTKCVGGSLDGMFCQKGYLCGETFCQLDVQSWPNDSRPADIPAIAANSSTTAVPVNQCNQFPITAILTGLFPGLVIGAILTYIATCCWDKRKKSKVQSFRRMPDANMVSSTQNVHPSHMRMLSTTSMRGNKSSVSTDLVIGFNPNEGVMMEKSAIQNNNINNVASPAANNVANKHTSANNNNNINAGGLRTATHNNTGLGVGGVQTGYQSSAPSLHAASTHASTHRADDDADPTRRGRLRVHGETPQLPSLHIGAGTLSPTMTQGPISGFGPMPMVTSPDQYAYAQQQQQQPMRKGHSRGNSNPRFSQITEPRYKFQGTALAGDRIQSYGSDTSVSSSVHSSVASERSARTGSGQRYPIAVPKQEGRDNRPPVIQLRNATQSSIALPNVVGIKIGTPKTATHPPLHVLTTGNTPSPTSIASSSAGGTNKYRNTHFELDDDFTPVTPMSPLDDNRPIPPPAPEPPTMPSPIYYGGHPTESTYSVDTHGRRLSTGSAISYATTAADPLNAYKSYVADEGHESMYPSSFYDVHFEASPVSAGATSNGGTTPTFPPAKARGVTVKLENVPAVPVIPALFAGHNKSQPRKSVLATVMNAADDSSYESDTASQAPAVPRVPSNKRVNNNNRNSTGIDEIVKRNKSLRRSESSETSAEVPFAIDNVPRIMTPGMPPKSPGAWSFVTSTTATGITVPTTTTATTVVTGQAKKVTLPSGGLGAVTMNGGRYTMQTHEMRKVTA